jgi:hypothetical protein
MCQPIDEVLGVFVGAQRLVLHQHGDDRRLRIHQTLRFGYRPVRRILGEFSALFELLEHLGFDRFDLQFVTLELQPL